mmetsp:Transcript_51096/g.100932  ORF Transcript_51096/g.100932 Transcript_51096/m.100932 type:complete len:218 (-) Transcript_51096:52-705(-)
MDSTFGKRRDTNSRSGPGAGRLRTTTSSTFSGSSSETSPKISRSSISLIMSLMAPGLLGGADARPAWALAVASPSSSDPNRARSSSSPPSSSEPNKARSSNSSSPGSEPKRSSAVSTSPRATVAGAEATGAEGANGAGRSSSSTSEPKRSSSASPASSPAADACVAPVSETTGKFTKGAPLSGGVFPAPSMVGVDGDAGPRQGKDASLWQGASHCAQ